jgi:hypothetical protein
MRAAVLLLTIMVGVSVWIGPALSEEGSPHNTTISCEGATRHFNYPEGADPQRRLSFSVWEFTSAMEAAAAASRVIGALSTTSAEVVDHDEGGVEVLVLDAPQVGDWSIAYLFPAEVRSSDQDDFTSTNPHSDIAAVEIVMIIQNGELLHVMSGADILMDFDSGPVTSDVLSHLVRTAESTLARASSKDDSHSSRVVYRTGGAWDHLPRLEDLPPTYDLGGDEFRPPLRINVVAPDNSATDQIASPPSGYSGSETRCVPGTPDVPSRHLLASVIDALSAQGLSVQQPPGVFVPRGAFSVPGQGVQIDGLLAYVFIYPDADTAAQDARQVTLSTASLELGPGTPTPLNDLHMTQGSNVIVVLIGGSTEIWERIRTAIASLD